MVKNDSVNSQYGPKLHTAVDILYVNGTYLTISSDKNIKNWHLNPG